MSIEIPELDCDLSPTLELAQCDWMLGLSMADWPRVRYFQLPREVGATATHPPADLVASTRQARHRHDFPARGWLEWWAQCLNPLLGPAFSACICNRSRRKGAIDLRLRWWGGPSTHTMLRHITAHAPNPFEWRIMLARRPETCELDALSRSIERSWGAPPPWANTPFPDPMFASWFRRLPYRGARLDKALCAWIDSYADSDRICAPEPIAPPSSADISKWLTSADAEVRSYAFRVAAGVT